MFARLLETLVLPPASVLLLVLLGTALRRWRPKAGRALQVLGLAWLWLASTPCVGGALLKALESSHPPLAPTARPAADAIVVLSAGADRVGAEFGHAVIGPTTMRRLRYGAELHRRTGLPMLVSGGLPALGAPSLAAMMQQAAEEELAVGVRWREERSADTRENAGYSAAILRRDGVRRIVLVTSAWHMPRAVACFEREGLEVVPAPTGLRGALFSSWTSFVPHWNGMRDTCLAMHELGGRVVYALRGPLAADQR